MTINNEEKDRIIEYIKKPIENGLWKAIFKFSSENTEIIKIIDNTISSDYKDDNLFFRILYLINALPTESTNQVSYKPPIQKEQLIKYFDDVENLRSFIRNIEIDNTPSLEEAQKQLSHEKNLVK